MPIYDQGYRRWNGELQRHPLRWWPILRQGVMQFLPQRKYLALLAVAWIVMIFNGARLFTQLKGAALVDAVRGATGIDLGDVGPAFYWEALHAQTVWALLFTVMVGSDLIAADRRNKALQLYFSKPITPNDYILGKLGVIAVFLAVSVWLPSLMLWLFGIAMEPTSAYLSAVWFVPLPLTLWCLLQILVMGLLMLAMSAVAQRPVFIAVSWFILFGYGPFQGIVLLLRNLSRSDAWSVINLADNLQSTGTWWFGLESSSSVHPAFGTLVLILAVVGCYVVVRRRIEPVEVVL